LTSFAISVPQVASEAEIARRAFAEDRQPVPAEVGAQLLDISLSWGAVL
jgi:hypothetical protein